MDTNSVAAPAIAGAQPKQRSKPRQQAKRRHLFPLFLADHSVLEISLESGNAYPPELAHIRTLGSIIVGLSRASRAIASAPERGVCDDTSAAIMQEAIGDAVQLLAMLSNGVAGAMAGGDA
jgi:hypothetical protein